MGINLMNDIGYLGIGKYKSRINSKLTKSYSLWQSIINKVGKLEPYIDCTVDERWYNFQVFAEWFENNYIDGFVIDKDILVKGNKIYSPETCCFVPQEINNLLVKPKNPKDLPIGVSKHKKSNKFQVGLKINGKRIGLGLFETIDEAFKIYKENKEFYIKQKAIKFKDILKPEVFEILYNYQITNT